MRCHPNSSEPMGFEEFNRFIDDLNLIIAEEHQHYYQRNLTLCARKTCCCGSGKPIDQPQPEFDKAS